MDIESGRSQEFGTLYTRDRSGESRLTTTFASCASLFSAMPEIIRFGASHFVKHDEKTSNLINRLFIYYGLEGIEMPYTLEDYRLDTFKEFLDRSTPEERRALLRNVPPDEILTTLPHEEILSRLPPEERLKGLPPEERLKGLSVEDLLRSLPEEVIREIRKRGENGNGKRSNGDE